MRASSADTRNQSELPPVGELLEGIALVPLGVFIAATVFPGFLLCVPALAFVGVVAIVLVAADTILVVLAGAILATPFALVLLARSVRRLSEDLWAARLSSRAPRVRSRALLAAGRSRRRPPTQRAAHRTRS